MQRLLIISTFISSIGFFKFTFISGHFSNTALATFRANSVDLYGLSPFLLTFIANVLERHTSEEKIAYFGARLKEKEQENLESLSANINYGIEKYNKITLDNISIR